MRSHAFLSTALALLSLGPAEADPTEIPVSGRPVPALAGLDTLMCDFMNTNGITAGVLGVMQNDRVIYQRGFGVDILGAPLSENAPLRLASLTKGITAAVIRELIDDGLLALTDLAFEVGQGGGILNVNPWPALVDNRIGTITINDLLHHRGGWDTDIDDDGTTETVDWTYQEINIASQMGIGSPPGAVNTMDFILGQPLQRNPGTGNSNLSYSNINYLALGLIAQQVTGQNHIDIIRSRVLTARRWVPSTEIFLGRTFRSQQNSREPRYDSTATVTNVFDSVGPDTVDRPYGGWDHEARFGQGALVASAATMLTLANTYRISYGSNAMGSALSDVPLTGTNSQSHTGSFPDGTNTAIWQRGDGLRIFVAFNGDDKTAGSNYAGTMRANVTTFLDSNVIPPITTTSDGFWTRLQGGTVGNVGGYHHPFFSFPQMLARTTAGSKVRLFPGSTGWSGKLSKRMRLDAPEGTATLGRP